MTATLQRYGITVYIARQNSLDPPAKLAELKSGPQGLSYLR